MKRLLLSVFLTCVIVLVSVANVDCAKSKKSKESGSKSAKKAKVVKDDPVSSDPESLNEEISNSDEKKAKDENKTKEKKPWKKMTKADWDRLENEAEEHEPWKPPEPPKVAFDPQNPMAYMQATKKGKPGMMFATLTKIKDEKTGKMRGRTKEETEEVSFKLKSLMQSGHLDATPYVIDPGKILWTVQDGSKGYTVKSFLMQQPEVEEFEWDNQKTPKSAWNPEGPEAEL